MISIWFFIGLSLLVNGALILCAGLYEWANPPAHPTVQLFQLHASVWWGALMTLLGAVYCIRYKPGQKKA
jgi:hypothetical protein